MIAELNSSLEVLIRHLSLCGPALHKCQVGLKKNMGKKGVCSFRSLFWLQLCEHENDSLVIHVEGATAGWLVGLETSLAFSEIHLVSLP